MNAPRWFYAVLAACTLALVGAAWYAAGNGRYVFSSPPALILDTRTGNVCNVQGGPPYRSSCTVE